MGSKGKKAGTRLVPLACFKRGGYDGRDRWGGLTGRSGQRGCAEKGRCWDGGGVAREIKEEKYRWDYQRCERKPHYSGDLKLGAKGG